MSISDFSFFIAGSLPALAFWFFLVLVLTVGCEAPVEMPVFDPASICCAIFTRSDCTNSLFFLSSFSSAILWWKGLSVWLD